MAPHSEYPFIIDTDGRLTLTESACQTNLTRDEVARRIKSDGLGVLLALLTITAVPNSAHVTSPDPTRPAKLGIEKSDGASIPGMSGAPLPYQVGGAPSNSMCSCMLPPGPKKAF